MNDRRRPPRPLAKPKPAAALSGPIELDTETRNALILFNARLEAQEAVERDKRRVDKAARAKDDAAAKVRALDADPRASAEAKATAQAAYLSALEAWNRAKSGEPEPAAATPPRGGESAESDSDVTDSEAEAEAEPPAEAEPTAEQEPTDAAESNTAAESNADPADGAD